MVSNSWSCNVGNAKVGDVVFKSQLTKSTVGKIIEIVGSSKSPYFWQQYDEYVCRVRWANGTEEIVDSAWLASADKKIEQLQGQLERAYKSRSVGEAL